MNIQIIQLIMIGVVLLVMVVSMIVFVSIFNVWLRCLMAGAQVSLFQIVGMKLRKCPAKQLCDLYIMSRQAGLRVHLSDLERAYLAGVDVELVVRAMIKASQTGQNLSWDDALSQAKKNQYDDYVEEHYGDGH